MQTNVLLKPFSWYEPMLDPVESYSELGAVNFAASWIILVNRCVVWRLNIANGFKLYACIHCINCSSRSSGVSWFPLIKASFHPLSMLWVLIKNSIWVWAAWAQATMYVPTGIYELVRHDVKPGLLSQFEHIAQQGMLRRLSYDYPKPVGMWYSDFGPSQRGSCKNSCTSPACPHLLPLHLYPLSISLPSLSLSSSPLCASSLLRATSCLGHINNIDCFSSHSTIY